MMGVVEWGIKCVVVCDRLEFVSMIKLTG